MALGDNTRTAYLWVNHPTQTGVRAKITITQDEQAATNATTQATNATNATTQATINNGGGNTGGGGCIMQDELILMDNGTSKKVQDIVVGDVVKSLSISGLSDEEYAWKTWSTVESEFSSSNISTTITSVVSETWPEYYTLSFNAGQESKSLKVTGEHPVLVKREDLSVAFIRVEDIVTGDSIRYFPSNSWATLTNVELIKDNTTPTYNLGAEEADNYAANGVIVHNVFREEEPNDKLLQEDQEQL